MFPKIQQTPKQHHAAFSASVRTQRIRQPKTSPIPLPARTPVTAGQRGSGIYDPKYGAFIRRRPGNAGDPVLAVRPSRVLPADLILPSGSRLLEARLDLVQAPGDSLPERLDWLYAGGLPRNAQADELVLLNLRLSEGEYAYRVESVSNLLDDRLGEHLHASTSYALPHRFSFVYRFSPAARDPLTGRPLLEFRRMDNSAYRENGVSAAAYGNWIAHMARLAPDAVVTAPLGNMRALACFTRFTISPTAVCGPYSSLFRDFIRNVELIGALTREQCLELQRMHDQVIAGETAFFLDSLNKNRKDPAYNGKGPHGATDLRFLLHKIAALPDPNPFFTGPGTHIGSLEGRGFLSPRHR